MWKIMIVNQQNSIFIKYDVYDPAHKYNEEESSNMKNGRKINCSMLRSFLANLHAITLAVSNGVKDVVAIGAPASEFVVLVKLFPHVRFHFFKDPFNAKKFDKRIDGHDDVTKKNIKIHNREIKDEDITLLTGTNLIVVCNIRQGHMARPGQVSMYKITHYQRGIIEKINPLYATMKFSVPYIAGTTEYMDGLLFPLFM